MSLWMPDQGGANTLLIDSLPSMLQEEGLPIPTGTWHLHLKSQDRAGNISETTSHYQVQIDVSAPNVSSFQATPQANGILLSWDKMHNTSDDFAQLVICRSTRPIEDMAQFNTLEENGRCQNITDPTTNTHLDPIAVPKQFYYAILSEDDLGNRSQKLSTQGPVASLVGTPGQMVNPPQTIVPVPEGSVQNPSQSVEDELEVERVRPGR